MTNAIILKENIFVTRSLFESTVNQSIILLLNVYKVNSIANLKSAYK